MTRCCEATNDELSAQSASGVNPSVRGFGGCGSTRDGRPPWSAKRRCTHQRRIRVAAPAGLAVGRIRPPRHDCTHPRQQRRGPAQRRHAKTGERDGPFGARSRNRPESPAPPWAQVGERC